MRSLAIVWIVVLFACGSGRSGEERKIKNDTATIGVDSTKVGADSGILKKLP